jgi:DNA-binding protein H-NS
MKKMLEKQEVQMVMSKNGQQENEAQPNNVQSKTDKLNGYFNKFKKGKSSPDPKASTQTLKTAKRGKMKTQRLIQSGKVQVKRNREAGEGDNKKSYLNKFLKISTKKEQISRNMLKRQLSGGQSKINDKMIGNNLKMQDR